MRLAAACSTNGLMPNCAACRRPTACFASAAAARRSWRGSKSAMRRWPRPSRIAPETLDRGGAAERRLRRKVVASKPRGRRIARSSRRSSACRCWRPHHSVRPARGRAQTRRRGRQAKSAPPSTRSISAPAFACGAGTGETPGRAALDKLVGKLESGRRAAGPASMSKSCAARAQCRGAAGRSRLRL